MEIQMLGAIWRRRARDYCAFVQRQVQAAESISDLAAGRAVLERFEEKWEQMLNFYVVFGVNYPEPGGLRNAPEEFAHVYRERAIQWRDVTKEYDQGYDVITARLAELQVAAEIEVRTGPRPDQRARMRAHL